MGFRVPSALAGDDNEVEMDEEGARTVLEMTAGTALGAGILAGGAMLYRRLADVAGTNKNVTELY
jgi:hypothetical protein